MAKKVLHCDADCFYAAVEVRDDPSLQGKALAIGGVNRGVVATCSYEARRFGVHSAMSSAYAKQRCPELIILPPNMSKYREAAIELKQIFFSVTPIVETVSLDEAYLDVTHVVDNSNTATEWARFIRRQAVEQVGITVSAGVSINKFIAKVASDWRKPDGLTVIAPAQVEAFVYQLPVKKVPGVGKATLAKLAAMGINTCGDVQGFREEQLVEQLGKFGQRLHQLSFGIDDRPVTPFRRRKSVSVEKTFDKDLGADGLYSKLPALLERLKMRLSDLTDTGPINKQFVKVKFSDFSQTTLEKTTDLLVWDDFYPMLKEASRRGSLSIRLMGLGVGFKEPSNDGIDDVQMELFED